MLFFTFWNWHFGPFKSDRIGRIVYIGNTVPCKVEVDPDLPLEVRLFLGLVEQVPIFPPQATAAITAWATLESCLFNTLEEPPESKLCCAIGFMCIIQLRAANPELERLGRTTGAGKWKLFPLYKLRSQLHKYIQ